jgi:hypothetical protein
MALSLTHCTYGQPINSMGIHLLEGSRTRKCTTSHDVQNTFASISKNVGFHIFHEQSHVLLMFSPLLQSSQQQVDVVLTTNEVNTMVEVVIINPTQANLVSKGAIF